MSGEGHQRVSSRSASSAEQRSADHSSGRGPREDGEERSAGQNHRSPWFVPIIYIGGLIFGFGLAISGMARPEVVLDFLQFEDFGLVFVMGGAAVVTGITFAVATRHLDRAPLTASEYTRRVKEFDRNVVIGGTIFGVGWGVSGICPGAAYASVGIGNYPIVWAIVGMFLGAYAHGYWRTRRPTGTDDVAETTTG